MHFFRHAKGKDLPMKIEPDEAGRVLFDFGYAANAPAPSKSGVHTIKVSTASGWTATACARGAVRKQADPLESRARDDRCYVPMSVQ